MIQIVENNNDLHDSIIWAIRFDDNLFFDIDFLRGCEENGESLLNLIVPATLIFFDVENLKINIQSEWVNGIEIDQLTIEETEYGLSVCFKLQEGEVSFVSKTYKLHLKGNVIKTSNSCLTEKERGGYIW